MSEFTYPVKSDPGALQKQLIAAGFNVRYITHSEITGTVVTLDETETKDPASVVGSYVYVNPDSERHELIAELFSIIDNEKADITDLRRALLILSNINGIPRR